MGKEENKKNDSIFNMKGGIGEVSGDTSLNYNAFSGELDNGVDFDSNIKNVDSIDRMSDLDVNGKRHINKVNANVFTGYRGMSDINVKNGQANDYTNIKPSDFADKSTDSFKGVVGETSQININKTSANISTKSIARKDFANRQSSTNYFYINPEELREAINSGEMDISQLYSDIADLNAKAYSLISDKEVAYTERYTQLKDDIVDIIQNHFKFVDVADILKDVESGMDVISTSLTAISHTLMVIGLAIVFDVKTLLIAVVPGPGTAIAAALKSVGAAVTLLGVAVEVIAIGLRIASDKVSVAYDKVNLTKEFEIDSATFMLEGKVENFDMEDAMMNLVKSQNNLVTDNAKTLHSNAVSVCSIGNSISDIMAAMDSQNSKSVSSGNYIDKATVEGINNSIQPLDTIDNYISDSDRQAVERHVEVSTTEFVDESEEIEEYKDAMLASEEAINDPFVVGFSFLADSLFVTSLVIVNEAISLFYEVIKSVLDFIDELINGFLFVVDLFLDYDLSYLRTLVQNEINKMDNNLITVTQKHEEVADEFGKMYSIIYQTGYVSDLTENYLTNHRTYFLENLPKIIKRALFGEEIEDVYKYNQESLEMQNVANEVVKEMISDVQAYSADSVDEYEKCLEGILNQTTILRVQTEKVV